MRFSSLRRPSFVATVIAATAVLGVPSATNAAPVVDPPVDYGLPAPGRAGFAMASNAAGTVVGFGGTAGPQAYRFRADTAPDPLGEPSGFTSSVALGVNAHDVAVGFSETGGGGATATLWAPDTAPVLLPTPTGFERTVSRTIADDGTVVGAGWDDDTGSSSALVWAGGTATALDPLGQPDAGALGINGSGVVVGYAGQADGTDPSVPMVWVPGDAALALPTLGGTQAYASSINDAGVVVGFSSTSGDAEVHLFRWTAGGGIEDLGVPPGGALMISPYLGFARNALNPAVNEHGQIALSAFHGSTLRGWVHSGADGFVALPPYPGANEFSYVTNIDDAGRITGSAPRPDDEFPATVWLVETPPPPAPPTPPGPPPPEPTPDPSVPGSAPADTPGTTPAAGPTGGATGAGQVPTLPATGPGALPVLLVTAGVLAVAGCAMTAGRRLTPLRVRARRRGEPAPPRDPRP